MSWSSENKKVLITESPRDAFQGIQTYIPAQVKAYLINQLIKTNLDIIDAGSFVSPVFIPQMKDTPDVLELLDMNGGKSKILVITGNEKYTEIACQFPQVTYIGYPFSVSETFLKRNLNSSFERSWFTIQQIHNLCLKRNKIPVIYITMAFGNDYGDPWSLEIIDTWVRKITGLGIRYISFTDPPGLADKDTIHEVFSFIINNYHNKIFPGFHLHTDPFTWKVKIDTAYQSGIRWFDGVITGHGGCPMTGKPLVGNVSTSWLIKYFTNQGCDFSLDKEAFQSALHTATGIFSKYT